MARDFYPERTDHRGLQKNQRALEEYLVDLGPLLHLRFYGSTTDHTAVIEDVLGELDLVGGGSLALPEKKILISSTVLVPSNVHIFGWGRVSEVHMTTADTQMFLCQGVTGVSFANFRLTGQGGFTTPGLGAIRLGLGSIGNGATDCWVSRCWIEGVSNNGVTIGSKSIRCRVSGCLVDGAGEEGVYLLGQDCEVVDNVLQNNGNAGAKVSSAINPLVSGNHCLRNLQQGINWTGASSGGAAVGNTCVENLSEGIRVADSPTDFSLIGNVCIANGQEADNTRGNITLNGTAIANCLIQGNVCRKGALAARSSHGLRIINGTGVLVGPNDLRGGGQTADYANTAAVGSVDAALLNDGGIAWKILSSKPQLRVQAEAGAVARYQLVSDTGQVWELRIPPGQTAFLLRDANSNTQPFQAILNTPTNTLRLEPGGVAFFAAGSFGGGVGVKFQANATTAPTSNPAGGGVDYKVAGADTYRGSGGSITTRGPA